MVETQVDILSQNIDTIMQYQGGLLTHKEARHKIVNNTLDRDDLCDHSLCEVLTASLSLLFKRVKK